MIAIAPSILSADFARMGEEIQAVDQAGADEIHVDVMDGHFVPNITIGPLVVKRLRPVTELPFDVHLMIRPVDPYLMEFVHAGSDIITVHAEATDHLDRSLSLIPECVENAKAQKESGEKPNSYVRDCRVGVSLNPHTPESTIEYVMDRIDRVLIMSVNPGFGGQSFIPSVLKKAERIKKMIEKSGRTIDLEIDGGITADNIRDAHNAGVEVFVAGSSVYGRGGEEMTVYKDRIRELRKRAR
ncbi:MAG: ribulose-phosphate 3-epimerase [Magnetococcales bacterium]|nr:ribulose-phosphate 3-epimerase [Magnetococcales bacterium]